MYKTVYKKIAGKIISIDTYTEVYTKYLLERGWYLDKEQAEKDK